eukprot:TRINITY_DN9760_c0_g1_i1.p1 TRINITY_DN9760_c0_g1~~TRINITY_DN9760_c0_g1_i1.p1  ORF type:complete len:512 (-),score=156.17 TRINITY_DN9760_c0_g1_i1:65-1600(-)
MSDLQWQADDIDLAENAIADVRNDESPTNWCFLTYCGNRGAASQRLKFGGSGDGGLEELRGHLEDDQCIFALLRVTDQIDDSILVKFVFINWLGNGVGRMQKARLSIHLAPIKTFIGQYHVDINCNSLDEVTAELVMGKVMDFSGSGSRVLDDTGNASLRNQASKAATTNTKSSTVSRGQKKVSSDTKDDVLLSPELKDAIQDVRNDETATTWVLFTYEEPISNTLVLHSSGAGDVAEIKENLSDDIVVYGIVRKEEIYDESVTIKFCYIRWLGEAIPRMQRAKLSIHSGDISDFFSPYHVDCQCTNQSEISDEIIEVSIAKASGTYEHTLDYTIPSERVEATRKVSNQEPGTSPRAAPAPTTNDSFIVLKNEEEIREHIQSVRDDNNDNDWCLVTYEGARSNVIELVGSGNGGLDELITKLTDDQVMYGIVRMYEQIDDSITVKFCFIDWRGQDIPHMQRAQIGTHSGEVIALFSPFHVDLLQVSSYDEVTEDIIQAKIAAASGTADFVR